MRPLAPAASSLLLVLGAFAAQGCGDEAEDSPAASRLEEAGSARVLRLANVQIGQHLALDAARSLVSRTVDLDTLAMGHVRFEQRFKGLPVFEGEAIAHVDLRTDSIVEVTDATHSIRADLAVLPTRNAAEARDVARKHAQLGGTATAASETLLVFPARGNDADRLAYRVTLTGETPEGPINVVTFVDAHTSDVLLSYDNIQTTAALGTAKTSFIGTAVPIGTDLKAPGAYQLVDPTRGGMSSLNLNYGMSGGAVFGDADNLWGSTLLDPATGGAEAMIGAELTWDYFAQTFNRRGIFNDGVGSQQRVHYLSGYNNAFWNDACKCMTYGDGDGVKFGPTYSIDVSAHEMTHGIIAATAKLTYVGESGALNESLADIFGTLVEYYASTRPGVVKTPNYLIGEDIVTPRIAGDFLRSMSNPKIDGKSIDHQSLNTASVYATTPAINGLHFASGLTNNVFYLLAEGGANATSRKTVTGIGRAKAGAIFYRAMTLYMTSGTTFAGARTATLSAAKDLYGASSIEANAVASAWYACGVGDAGSGVGSPAPGTGIGGGTDAGLTTDAGATAPSTGMSWSGTVSSGATANYATPALAAGTYRVAMTGTGDADLYVKLGAVPTTTSYTCRPYQAGTNETCTVALTTSTTVNVLVKGVAASSNFTVAVARP